MFVWGFFSNSRGTLDTSKRLRKKMSLPQLVVPWMTIHIPKMCHELPVGSFMHAVMHVRLISYSKLIISVKGCMCVSTRI